jgi:hypothetical protein
MAGLLYAHCDRMHRSKIHPYSITSSARVSIVGGMVKRRSLAVLRLITSSNFKGRFPPNGCPGHLVEIFDAQRHAVWTSRRVDDELLQRPGHWPNESSRAGRLPVAKPGRNKSEFALGTFEMALRWKV